MNLKTDEISIIDNNKQQCVIYEVQDIWNK